jgi:protein-arginine kinase activator protein McsA
MTRWTVTAAMVATLTGAAACSSDEQAPVCDSVAAVQASVVHVRDANVSENGLAELRSQLTELKGNLQQLYTDAQSQYATQAAAVKASADAFVATLTTARTTPSAQNLAAVQAGIAGLRTTVQQLADTVKSTC